MMDIEEKRRRARERDKERWVTDPEYRRKKKERSKARHRLRYKTDPEYHKKCNDRKMAWRRKKYENDPEFRKNHNAKRCRLHKEKCAADPEYHRLHKIKMNLRHRKLYETDPEYRKKCNQQTLMGLLKLAKTKPEHYKRYVKENNALNAIVYRYRRKNDTEYSNRVCQKRREKNKKNRSMETYKKQLCKDEIRELKRRFLEALEKSAFIGLTAKYLDISETRVHNWMRNDPKFANDVRAAQARTAERVGLALISKALTENDTSAQIFICKTLGRSLGFDEKQPVVNINMTNQSEMDLSGLSLEEKEQFLLLLRKSKQSGQIGQDTIDV
jgi:hypothetical protein